jgi:hypothetical protein
VCDEVNTSKMQEDLTVQLGDYYKKYGRRYHDILTASKLWVDHAQVDKENDLNHIEYVIPVNDLQKQRLYTQFIARECNLCGLVLHGTHVEEWRNLLRGCVETEKCIAVLEKVQQWDSQ